jgi:hypothetical protein
MTKNPLTKAKTTPPVPREIHPPSHHLVYGVGFALGALLGGAKSYVNRTPEGRKAWSQMTAKVVPASHHASKEVAKDMVRLEADIAVGVFILKGWIKQLKEKINPPPKTHIIKPKRLSTKRKQYFKKK